jgi:hypothetical protein
MSKPKRPSGRPGNSAAESATKTTPAEVLGQKWPRYRKATQSLLDFEWPPGFDEYGRHLLDECAEFKLYELYRLGGELEVEYAPAVERALFRSLFRITEPDEPIPY